MKETDRAILDFQAGDPPVLMQATPEKEQQRRRLRRQTALAGILVLIPALLFVFWHIRNLPAPPAGFTASSLTSYGEEQMKLYEKVPEIQEWLSGSRQKDPEGVYVLCHEEELREEESGRKKTVYLIYRPSAGYMKEIRETEDTSVRGGSGRLIAFEDTSDSRWSHAYFPLTCFTCEGDTYPGLKLTVDGQSVDYELKKVDFDPSLDACCEEE